MTNVYNGSHINAHMRVAGNDITNSNPFPLKDPWIAHAENEVLGTYGDVVSVAAKQKSLLKFGRNDDVGTSFETVWLRGGDETYATDNTIDTISSSDAGDTQTVTIEGHTLSGSDLTFVVQSATLDGQNKVVLTTPLYRSSRMYNTSSTDFAGTIYVYEDGAITSGVPDTAADIHIQSDGSNNQTLKAATSFSSTDYCFITLLYFGVNRQNSRSVDFRLQVREFGKTFRTKFSGAAHSESGLVTVKCEPVIIIPPNTDIRWRAISSGVTTGVEAGFNSVLATIQT